MQRKYLSIAVLLLYSCVPNNISQNPKEIIIAENNQIVNIPQQSIIPTLPPSSLPQINDIPLKIENVTETGNFGIPDIRQNYFYDIDNNGNGILNFKPIYLPTSSGSGIAMKDFNIIGNKFDIGTDFGASENSIDKNGNGLIVWGSDDKFFADVKPINKLYLRKIENFIPVGLQIQVADNDIKAQYKPSISIDNQGNGKIGWITDKGIISVINLQNYLPVKDSLIQIEHPQKVLDGINVHDPRNAKIYFIDENNLVIYYLNKALVVNKVSELKTKKNNEIVLSEDLEYFSDSVLDKSGNGYIARYDSKNNQTHIRLVNNFLPTDKVNLYDDMAIPFFYNQQGDGVLVYKKLERVYIKKLEQLNPVGSEVKFTDTELAKDNIRVKFTDDHKGIISWSKISEIYFKIFKADITF